MGIGVEDEAIHAVRPIIVALRLQHAGMVPVAALHARGRERLGSHHLTPVGMSNRGCQIGHSRELIVAHPELAHGHIGLPAYLKGVEGAFVGLGQEAHAVLFA